MENRGTTRRVERGGIWTQVLELPTLRIEVEEGPDRGRSWDLGHDTIRLGSAPDNDVVLQDPEVSRHHAWLERCAGGLRLRDLESTNGTYVHDVCARDAVFEGEARFRIGSSRLSVRPSTGRFVAVEEAVDGLGPLIGGSGAMRRIYALLQAAAPTPVTIMLTGESGTGKELVARAVHELSGRKGSFVAFDCASTGPDLIRSELFGHVRGAFTGADAARKGAFRQAHGGTLFVDELGELPATLQPVLLRVLETRSVQPLGSDDLFPVDVRLVVATNRDLKQMVAKREFRDDLYNRLSVVRIHLPAVRERLEDLPLLVDHFVRSSGMPCAFTAEAKASMRAHSWPGNVRELRNVVERVGALCRGRAVTAADLDLEGPVASPPAAGLQQAIGVAERESIVAALRRHDWNKTRTAKALGIGLSTLKRKLAEHRILRESDS